MSELQERFQRWADELVDLTARNELINFKVTKTSTILPDPKGLSKLLNGDTVAITDLCDLWRSSQEEYDCACERHREQLKGCWARRANLFLKEVSSLYPEASGIPLSVIEEKVRG